MGANYQQDGSSVEVRDGNVSKALQVLKRNLKAQNLFIEIKKRKEFKKPSTLRKEKKNLEQRRAKFKQLEENEKKY